MTQKIKNVLDLTVYFVWVFFHKHLKFTGQPGKGKDISLTPLNHFYYYYYYYY